MRAVTSRSDRPGAEIIDHCPRKRIWPQRALNHSLADCATTLDATVHRRRTKRRLPARFASYIAWSASASNRSTNSASS